MQSSAALNSAVLCRKSVQFLHQSSSKDQAHSVHSLAHRRSLGDLAVERSWQFRRRAVYAVPQPYIPGAYVFFWNAHLDKVMGWAQSGAVAPEKQAVEDRTVSPVV
jgi:hypothetical protein